MLDPIQMSLHPFHDSDTSFPYILHFAGLALDAVYQIGTLTSYIFLATVFHTGICAGYSASVI